MSDPWLLGVASNLKERALNLFLRPNCPLCDRSALVVCCEYCQRQIHDERLERPDRYWQGDMPLFAWGKYQGAIKRSIGKFKYDGHRSIGDFYGELIALSWQQFAPPNLPTKLVVVPIPLHAEKLATRGFNQAESIARKFCYVTGAKLDVSLHRTRSTVPQFGLSKSDRQQNVEGAFVLKNSPLKSGSTVLLIDDIYTTGATVRSAATALKSHNINVCGVAVIAIAGDSSN